MDVNFVRVENGVVLENLTIDESFASILLPDGGWVNVTGMSPMPVQDWLYVGGVFSPPPIIISDPRPPLEAELKVIDRDSIGALRALIVSVDAFAEGSPERAAVDELNARALAIRAQLDALDAS